MFYDVLSAENPCKSRLIGTAHAKTLIFQWVQVKTKNAPILAFMLEFVLELLEKC